MALHQPPVGPGPPRFVRLISPEPLAQHSEAAATSNAQFANTPQIAFPSQPFSPLPFLNNGITYYPLSPLNNIVQNVTVSLPSGTSVHFELASLVDVTAFVQANNNQSPQIFTSTSISPLEPTTTLPTPTNTSAPTQFQSVSPPSSQSESTLHDSSQLAPKSNSSEGYKIACRDFARDECYDPDCKFSHEKPCDECGYVHSATWSKCPTPPGRRQRCIRCRSFDHAADSCSRTSAKQRSVPASASHSTQPPIAKTNLSKAPRNPLDNNRFAILAESDREADQDGDDAQSEATHAEALRSLHSVLDNAEEKESDANGDRSMTPRSLPLTPRSSTVESRSVLVDNVSHTSSPVSPRTSDTSSAPAHSSSDSVPSGDTDAPTSKSTINPPQTLEEQTSSLANARKQALASQTEARVQTRSKKQIPPPPPPPRRLPPSVPTQALVSGLNPTLFLSLESLNAPRASDADSKYFYQDPSGATQGPFSEQQMQRWYDMGALQSDLKVRHETEIAFTAIKERDPPYTFTQTRSTPHASGPTTCLADYNHSATAELTLALAALKGRSDGSTSGQSDTISK